MKKNMFFQLFLILKKKLDFFTSLFLLSITHNDIVKKGKISLRLTNLIALCRYTYRIYPLETRHASVDVDRHGLLSFPSRKRYQHARPLSLPGKVWFCNARYNEKRINIAWSRWKSLRVHRIQGLIHISWTARNKYERERKHIEWLYAVRRCLRLARRTPGPSARK